MASDLQTMQADPEFYKLSDDDKKKVISRVDSSFLDLSKDDQARVIGKLSSGRGRTREEMLSTAGKPADIDPLRETKETLGEMIPFRGSLDALSAGYKSGQDVLGDNLAGKALGAVFGGAMASGTALNPIAAPLMKGLGYIPRLAQAGGEALAGQGAMANETLQGRSEVLPGAKPAMTQSTLANMASDLITQARKDPLNAAMLLEGATRPEVVNTVKSLPSSLSDAAAAAKLKLGNAVSRLQSSPKAIVADLARFNPTESVQIGKIVDGSYEDTLPEIKKYFKEGSGVKGYLDAASAFLQNSFKIYEPVIRSASESEVDPEAIYNMADKNLEKTIPNPETRKALLSKYDSDLDYLTPKTLLTEAKRINNELNSFYSSPTSEASPDMKFAAKAVRDAYGSTIQTILQNADVDPLIYKRVGTAMELSDQIGQRFSTAQNNQLQLQGQGAWTRVKNGKGGSIAGNKFTQVVSSIAAPLTGGEEARLNNQANKLFKMVKNPSEELASTPTPPVPRMSIPPEAEKDIGRNLGNLIYRELEAKQGRINQQNARTEAAIKDLVSKKMIQQAIERTDTEKAAQALRSKLLESLNYTGE